jgi:hypothetical protein
MRKAIWFSRHDPTPRQIVDARRWGYDLIVTPQGKALGAMELRSGGDVVFCIHDLLVHAGEQEADAIFGVFPTPIISFLVRAARDTCPGIPCYSSWNVARSREGGQPTFEHYEWCYVGDLRSHGHMVIRLGCGTLPD